MRTVCLTALGSDFAIIIGTSVAVGLSAALAGIGVLQVCIDIIFLYRYFYLRCLRGTALTCPSRRSDSRTSFKGQAAISEVTPPSPIAQQHPEHVR